MLTMILRRTAIATLLGALGFGAWKWDGLGHDEWVNAPERLQSRMAEYSDLRLQNDWVSLYEMVAPMHRSRMPLKKYLNYFDHDVIRTLEVAPRSTKIDPITRTALIQVFTRGEFLPENLPEQFRRGFRGAGTPDDYVNDTEFALSWHWVDDQWYFLLDAEILTGRGAGGGDVRSVNDAASQLGGESR